MEMNKFAVNICCAIHKRHSILNYLLHKHISDNEIETDGVVDGVKSGDSRHVPRISRGRKFIWVFLEFYFHVLNLTRGSSFTVPKLTRAFWDNYVVST